MDLIMEEEQLDTNKVQAAQESFQNNVHLRLRLADVNFEFHWLILPWRQHLFENPTQRDIERRRKAELYEQKNKEAENSRLARNLRALERNNQTQKKKGRRLMKRSMMQTKPTVTKSLEQFKDLIDLSDEDSSYFFM